jgi:hypothetical protein
MATNNPFMDAINEHCTSLIDIMAKGDLSFKELKGIQLRFRSFDALLEDMLQDVREDLKEESEKVKERGKI